MRNDTKKLYPEDWEEISIKIRKKRKNRCEFCGITDYKARKTNNALTVHHLDYNPQNNDEKNLKLLCAKCHLKLQGKQHKKMMREIMYRNLKDVKPIKVFLKEYR